MRKCKSCQTYSQTPRRFKSTLCDDKDFNYTVFVDIFYIDKRPVPHVFDNSTRKKAVIWLPNVTEESVCIAMHISWIEFYLGPPDIVAHNAGKQFFSFPKKCRAIAYKHQVNPSRIPQLYELCRALPHPNQTRIQHRDYRDPLLDAEAALQIGVSSPSRFQYAPMALFQLFLSTECSLAYVFSMTSRHPQLSKGLLRYKRRRKQCPSTSPSHMSPLRSVQ